MQYAGSPQSASPGRRLATGMDVPSARLRVPRESTQPPGDELLSHSALLSRLDELGQSERVQVSMIGTTHEGRAIPLITISHRDVIADGEAVRRGHLARAVPAPGDTLADGCDDGPLPVLFLSSDHGFEASQVSALLELSEYLAAATDPWIDDLLRTLVVLVIPVASPDGYERSRAEWRTHPFSSGLSGGGNHYGVGVSGEYLHSDQPETVALRSLISRWQPGVVWQPHEDVTGLGRAFPEVTTAGPAEAESDDDSAAAIWSVEQRIGAAIADAWRARGYDVLPNHDGRHGWPGRGDGVELHRSPRLRLSRVLSLLGVVSLVTANCRTPGSQPWIDRNEQKHIAGRTILEQASGMRADILQARRAFLRRAMEHEPESCYVLPAAQDPAVLSRAVALLNRTDIQVCLPGGQGDIFVPRRQPFSALADLLLSEAHGGDASLVSALGLKVVVPRAAERRTTAGASQSAPGGRPDQPPGTVENRPGEVRFGGLHAVVAVNRLLRLPGTGVSWLPDGSFRVRAPGGEGRLASVMRGLSPMYLDGAGPDGGFELVRTPRIGVFSGQGVKDMPWAGGLGPARWFMRVNEFDSVLVEPRDIAAGALAALDVLLVPAGDAREILRGWNDADILRRFPWETPGEPEGLAGEGISAIRRFVEGGGAFIGIGAGGGWLATRDHAHLLDVGIAEVGDAQHRIGPAPEDVGDLLFAGIGPVVAASGGTAFSHGPSVRRLASYVPVPGERTSGGAPIVEGDVGDGTVVLFGFDPTRTTMALRTARLLSHALLRTGIRTAHYSHPRSERP
ncbi:M14 family zinc carboxypeptidase [Phytoactinopolyspora mesophila]|uniref:Peptidase M14 domain-containing protein n=1 Tax=Phytoactinopolyspora mesophila TaxID=2650750 RepID=A0A7K3M8S6_9ACTN|nr:M14 family zinc carboxypeptidase [Phytoactinopolyspora mesophila]NDL59377.1 hypothetical protein [Phytoactinopolyspora mesophila]